MTDVTPPIDMETFENSIHNWFCSSMGIQVIWQNQSAPRPDYPYGSLMIISGPVLASNVSEYRHNYDSEREEGKEIEINGCVLCTFVVSCQTYVSLPAANVPLYNAQHYLNLALAGLSMPTKLDELAASNVAVYNKGSIQKIPEIVGDSYLSRANMDITFGTSLNAKDYITYIEQVELKSNSFNVDTIVSI